MSKFRIIKKTEWYTIAPRNTENQPQKVNSYVEYYLQKKFLGLWFKYKLQINTKGVTTKLHQTQWFRIFNLKEIIALYNSINDKNNLYYKKYKIFKIFEIRHNGSDYEYTFKYAIKKYGLLKSIGPFDNLEKATNYINNITFKPPKSKIIKEVVNLSIKLPIYIQNDSIN